MIRGGINPQISYAFKFAEWEACVAANLDLYKWVYGVYPNEFKVDVLAWHELHNQVKSHSESAAIEAAKRKGKKH